ncbi:MAG: acetate/propionate family kinase [Thermoplasmata archaeon]
MPVPPRSPARILLALNVGSSSVKFSLFRFSERWTNEERLISGSYEAIGERRPSITIRGPDGSLLEQRSETLRDHAAAIRDLLAWIRRHGFEGSIEVVGHRIVHGGRKYSAPVLVTPRILRDLGTLRSLDPDHVPIEIEAVRTVRAAYPSMPQVLCFDTYFHRTMTGAARTYAVPREMTRRGIVRFGFHGLSCEYIVAELARASGGKASPRRLIVAHLGGGSSMTAILRGQSQDTTMGFSPTGGLVMGTRCGDLDPSVVLYIAQERWATVPELRRTLNERSGLLGVSGISSDMRELEKRRAADRRAAEAIDLYCYQARKYLCALTAPLGGLDMVVFTGGIGERSPYVRQQICDGLVHLGIRLDPRRNRSAPGVISRKGSPVTVRVIPTDEDRVIAQHSLRTWKGAGAGHAG